MDKDWISLLDRYEAQLDQLTTMSDQLLSLLSALSLPILYSKTLALKQRIAAEILKVYVIGRPGQGKSTLINGLRDQSALSTFQAPTRFVFYEASWGEESGSTRPADAVLVVLSCDSLPTREEFLEFDRIQYEGHKAIFFLCNRFDLLEPSAQMGVKRRFLSLLSSLPYYNEEYVFFTDAKDRLVNRPQADDEYSQEADLSLLADILYEFLIKQCGWARFIQYVAEYMAIGQGALPVLSAQKQLRHTDRQELQARYFKAENKIERLEKLRQHISNLFLLTLNALKEKVRMAATNFFLDSTDIIEDKAQTFNTAPSPLGTFTGNAQEKLLKELITFLTAEIIQSFQAWVQLVLQPLLQERLLKLEPELDEYTSQFVLDLESVWTELVGKKIVIEKSGEILWTEGIHKILHDATTRISSTVSNNFCRRWHASFLLAHPQNKEELRNLITNKAGQDEIKRVLGQEYRFAFLSSYQHHIDSMVETVGNELQHIQQEVDSALALDLQIIHSATFAHELRDDSQDE